MYGNFYILGPWWVNSTLQLVPNPGKCTKHFAAATLLLWH